MTKICLKYTRFSRGDVDFFKSTVIRYMSDQGV